jgi:hypothetical protein
MQRVAVAIASSLGVVSVLVADDRPRGPVRLYVTMAPAQSRPDATGQTKDALKVRRDRARAVRRFREKQLKNQYGKRRESWPPEPTEELIHLEDSEALAETAYEYRKADPQGISESVHEIAEFFQERGAGRSEGRVALCSSAAEADLVIAVAASRTGKTLPTQERPDRCYLLFTVGAGGRMEPDRFARLPMAYRTNKLGLRVWRIAGPRPESPIFYFESYNGGGKEFGCYRVAADAASAAVDKFIEDNYGILTGP